MSAGLDLADAEMALAVANTPLFLLRKLRSDSSVQSISRAKSVAEILDALIFQLKRQPENLTQEVEPYVYLVALSMKRDLPSLKQAANMDAPHTKWFRYLAEVLVDEYKPTLRENIEPTSQVDWAVSSSASSLPTRKLIIPVGGGL
jgi:hypothetical protein